MWIDNALDRGYVLYLTNVPGLAGFEPVEEARLVLIDALKSIHPPGRDEGEGRFRPYDGSDNWVGKAEDSGEEDEGRWETIAVSQGPTDFAGLEAECVVSEVSTEYRPAYWRGQPYHGLAMRHPNRESFLAFARSFPDQYVLTRAALSYRYLEVK